MGTVFIVPFSLMQHIIDSILFKVRLEIEDSLHDFEIAKEYTVPKAFPR